MDQSLFPEIKNVNKYYQPMTKNNYSLSLVVSALQKSIRLGMECEAGYFALELIDSGYMNYLCQRLVIISCEDAGNINLIIQAFLLYDFVVKFRKEKKRNPDESVVMRLVLDLCRAIKDREADDYKIYCQEIRRNGWKPRIIDAFADFHTSEGKAREPNLSKAERIKRWKTLLTKVNKEKSGNKYKNKWTSF